MLKATKSEGKSVKYAYVNEEDDVDGEVILHFMKSKSVTVDFIKSYTRGKGTLRKIVREIQSTFKGFTITLETHNSFIDYWRQFDNHIDTREVDRLGYIKIRLDSTLDF